MIVLLASRADPASVTLRDALLARQAFGVAEMVGDLTLRRADGLALAEIDGPHLHADGVEPALAGALRAPPEAILVLSKHKSESGTPTLTTHPVGNWGPRADFGGQPRAVAPAAARLMSAVLREMAASPPAGYAVSFEATHHGPLLSVPTAYVEVGSDARAWEDRAAADAVAAAVLRALARPQEGPVLLGVGGGHYVPRFTDLARKGRACFGHLLPSYALADVDEATLRAAAAGHDAFVVDRRGEPAALDRVVGILRGLLREASEKA